MLWGSSLSSCMPYAIHPVLFHPVPCWQVELPRVRFVRNPLSRPFISNLKTICLQSSETPQSFPINTPYTSKLVLSANLNPPGIATRSLRGPPKSLLFIWSLSQLALAQLCLSWHLPPSDSACTSNSSMKHTASMWYAAYRLPNKITTSSSGDMLRHWFTQVPSLGDIGRSWWALGWLLISNHSSVLPLLLSYSTPFVWSNLQPAPWHHPFPLSNFSRNSYLHFRETPFTHIDG